MVLRSRGCDLLGQFLSAPFSPREKPVIAVFTSMRIDLEHRDDVFNDAVAV
jgi:hypothetical protein